MDLFSDLYRNRFYMDISEGTKSQLRMEGI